MSLSMYFLGSFKDGQYQGLEELREKSESKKLVLFHEDATTNVYDDVDYDNVTSLYVQACANEGKYIIYNFTENEHGDCLFEVETSDSELMDSKVVCAYDEDGDSIYAVSYLDVDENDIFATCETIGKEEALKQLHIEIDGDEDVFRIDE